MQHVTGGVFFLSLPMLPTWDYTTLGIEICIFTKSFEAIPLHDLHDYSFCPAGTPCSFSNFVFGCGSEGVCTLAWKNARHIYILGSLRHLTCSDSNKFGIPRLYLKKYAFIIWYDFWLLCLKKLIVIIGAFHLMIYLFTSWISYLKQFFNGVWSRYQLQLQRVLSQLIPQAK